MKIILAINKAKPKKFVEFTLDLTHKNIKHEKSGEFDGSVFCALHSSNIFARYGDYISIQNEDDMYPIDKAYFAEHYDIQGHEMSLE